MSLSTQLKSDAAKQLFADLKVNNLLVDVYSKEWFDTRDENCNYFPKSLLGNIEDEYDPKFFNHLLVIHVDEYNQNFPQRIVQTFPCLSSLINEGIHKPDFLFVNINISKILCVGLGRKNQLFAIDAETNKSVNAFDLTHGDDAYIEEFTEDDHLEVVSDIVRALFDLGVAFFENDSIPSNETDLYQAIESEPDEEGFYHLEWDDEDYTKEQLEEFLEEKERQNEIMKESEEIIQLFFPDAYEFNTGDY